MRFYSKPTVYIQERLRSPILTQYSFLITPENCPGGVETNEGLTLTDQALIGCGNTDPDEDRQWTFQCQGFSGTYFFVTDISNFSKVINSPDCTEDGPNLFRIPATVTPSLPGDCVVTSVTGADINGDACVVQT